MQTVYISQGSVATHLGCYCKFAADYISERVLKIRMIVMTKTLRLNFNWALENIVQFLNKNWRYLWTGRRT